MQRRDFLMTTAAAFALPGLAAANPLPYTPALHRELRREGDVAVYLFWSEWSLTCGFQKEALEALKAENPAYADRLTFVLVDHDTFGTSRMAQAFKVPRRSTLLVVQNGKEISRVVEDTRPDAIRALLDTALKRAAPELVSN